jgi:hypothetical protein
MPRSHYHLEGGKGPAESPGQSLAPRVRCGGFLSFPRFCVTCFRAHLIPTELTVHHKDTEKVTSLLPLGPREPCRVVKWGGSLTEIQLQLRLSIKWCWTHSRALAEPLHDRFFLWCVFYSVFRGWTTFILKQLKFPNKNKLKNQNSPKSWEQSKANWSGFTLWSASSMWTWVTSSTWQPLEWNFSLMWVSAHH